ncbi:50S ribosomal protein L32 [Candidatus Microgenomates bacterium]|nr:50S ribosomal protein L32 [Candidatus Microgenomates bacterium]
MPQEPKRRHSRQRQGKRRASISFSLLRLGECKNCHHAKTADFMTVD